MKKILPILIIALVMVSCHTAKKVSVTPPVVVTNSDSIRVKYVESVRIDTVSIEIPLPIESVMQAVRDTASHIETSLAFSDAWINEDGTLGHSIANKDGVLHGQSIIPIINTSTTSNKQTTKEIPVPYPEPYYVDRPPNLLESIKIKAFWPMVIVLVLLIAWTFRKPLFSFLDRFI